MPEPIIIGNATLLQGDCLAVMPTLPDNSVHCCVTSPPYFGLRDYGTAQWAGGDPACAHGIARWDGPKQTQGAQSGHASQADRLTRDRCPCGALRVDQQIGLEPTPEEYITKMVSVFREVRRVLRDDGTCWVNIGDSYNGGGVGGGGRGTLEGASNRDRQGHDRFPVKVAELKTKDLIGIPWLLAFALRADGWYLRQDIIWAKPNPMPESVTDRCTKAHEYVFLLTKSARYWYDAEAVKEPASQPIGAPSAVNQHKQVALGTNFGGTLGTNCGPEIRNRRSVWSIASQPYDGAHFAVMPQKLVEPCILAGCPVGGTVLDPFNGAATVGVVALAHGRQYLGIELNPEYVRLSVGRLTDATRQGQLFSLPPIPRPAPSAQQTHLFEAA
ncbi:MAG: site-specific DNA-methyltransferase [Chromatiaceae bacterium]|nr:site-specific DNA-methyltransferase [Chromatiaceae bacterium]